jgi:hypothetical protein
MIDLRAITIQPGVHIKTEEQDFIVERPVHDEELVTDESGQQVTINNTWGNRYWVKENIPDAPRRLLCLDLVWDDQRLSKISITVA